MVDKNTIKFEKAEPIWVRI